MLGVITEERYCDKRWRFLKNVTNLPEKAAKYWRKRRNRIHAILVDDDKLWISRYPEQVLAPLAEKHGAVLFANAFDINEGCFSTFDTFDALYRKAARSAKPGLVVDSPRRAVNTGIETVYVYNGKAFHSASSCRRFQVLVGVYTILVLFCMGAGIGLISMYFGASSMLLQMFLSYFKIPLLPVLNILPVVVLIFLMYFISNRVWLSFFLTALFTLVLTWINYFKLVFRNDPLLASDFRLISETEAMIGKFKIVLNWKFIAVIVFCILVALAAVFLARARIKSARVRTGGILVTVCLAIFCYTTVYTSPAVYAKTENLALISRWSATQQYISRGFIYPFLYSVQSAIIRPPEGYDKGEAEKQLFEYAYDNIQQDGKVNVVAVMCEALNDFSKFNELEFIEDIYEPLHELEARSVSGELITNIFAGGTVDTEWEFLTGYTRLDDFRAKVNSYVRYFKEQGYYTEGSHPCYEWFYNRLNVNQHLGFDNYYYYENKYYDLSGSIAGDDILFPEIISLYEKHVSTQDSPYFSFNVTYQNHGPYAADAAYYEREYIKDKGYSEQTKNIVNNYFAGIANTISNISKMADYFAGRSEPVVLVIFGDHNPWLGDANSAYKEIGIDFDLSTEEGFKNYYSTPYLIYANDAAKQALGNDFIGDGGDFSPCFLMNKLFELAGWGGNEFMKLSNEVRAVTPLMHKTGVYLADGELTSDISEELIGKFARLQYYWRWNFRK
jgi:phosphoglycerol transferase MdoB-like AlkP superfamily enzyme